MPTSIPCVPNPCVNGICNGASGAPTCVCHSGFSGPTCATNVDDCAPNPCLHGGTCFDEVDHFTCSCIPEWNGPTCERCGTPCSDRPSYFQGRFLTCYRDTAFCTRPGQTCESFCSGWMGCSGPLAIDSDGVGTVTGPSATCF